MTTSNPTQIAALSSHPGAVHVAACALRVALTDDLTRLIPAGRFEAPRGALSGAGPWFLSESNARAIMAGASARSTDIVIDYEHQTLLAEQNGKPAPASGWIDPRSLEWRDDGLYGRVRWTAAAKKSITPGPDGEPPEYLYLSPVFPYDAETGEVLDLLHVALTNTPAIDTAVATLAAARMAAARSATTTAKPEDTDVKREDLIQMLGLEPVTTDKQIEQALAALKAGAAQTNKLRETLQLADDADPVAAVAALKAGTKPDMSQYVPRAVFDETNQQLAALKAGSETAELDTLIETGLQDGRIAGKATADWLRTQGLAACRAHMKDAPALPAFQEQQKGRVDTEKDKGQGKDGLSAEELAVCKSMGLTPEAYRKANPVE
ncbi:phage protease [Marinobacterium sp. MBR-109]|uniref:phage protease n=1 Tax=Marinobacterium sp. MBR-109 TaxID=3156462 RepID=UPI0033932FD0